MIHNNEQSTKPIRLICLDGLTKPLFLGRLKHERLTIPSNMGSLSNSALKQFIQVVMKAHDGSKSYIPNVCLTCSPASYKTLRKHANVIYKFLLWCKTLKISIIYFLLLFKT